MCEYKIPQFLLQKLENQYGIEITEKILNGYKVKRPVTFRVNTIKSNVEEIEKILIDKKIKYNRVIWNKEAFIIQKVDENEIQNLDIYKEGKIYLQSLSSMLPPIILNPKEECDILDMAAAPGGKTTQIAAITNNNANITACEMNHIRCEKLKYNIEKQGATSVYIMETDSRRIDSFFSFDQILLDSPCSGSGTININDKKIEETFTLNLLKKVTKSQIDMINKAIEILKPGGEIVYSTCSILKEENEDIINKILKTKKVQIVPIHFFGIEDLPKLPTLIDGTVCIAPNELYEGFFITKLRKL